MEIKIPAQVQANLYQIFVLIFIVALLLVKPLPLAMIHLSKTVYIPRRRGVISIFYGQSLRVGFLVHSFL